MKKNLSRKELVYIASMLFGLFFGAGNLIFPIYMGQLAGTKLLTSAIGFLITGVGLPLLGVTAIGISRSDGLIELSGKVGKGYSVFFTCALYLTIGPFFAIPRCATVPFTVGAAPLLGNADPTLALALFSTAFFAAVLGFSLFPGKILTYVGKILNPIFLVFLGALILTALIFPKGSPASAPVGNYASMPFMTGFLEGYNTMDALASLAFGIVVVTVIRDLGITEPADVARNTVKAGAFSCIIMSVIYFAVAYVGSVNACEGAQNGGDVFAFVANRYFGRAGAPILAAIVTFACLKTAVGLVTSCSETFVKLFPKLFGYKTWAVIFSIVSFLIANLGLTAIITYAVPVLMFLYPPAITLILLGIFGKYFSNSKYVYGFVTGFTLFAAVFDFLGALPESVISAIGAKGIINFSLKVLPFASMGLGWIVPAIVGLVIGLIVKAVKK